MRNLLSAIRAFVDHYKDNPDYQFSKSDHRYHRIQEILNNGHGQTPEDRAELRGHLRDHFRQVLPNHPGSLNESDLGDFQEYHGYSFDGTPNERLCWDVTRNPDKYKIDIEGDMDWGEFSSLTGCADPLEWRRRMLGKHPLIDPEKSRMSLSLDVRYDDEDSENSFPEAREYFDLYRQATQNPDITTSDLDTLHGSFQNLMAETGLTGDADFWRERDDALDHLFDQSVKGMTGDQIRGMYQQVINREMERKKQSGTPFHEAALGVESWDDFQKLLNEAVHLDVDHVKHGISDQVNFPGHITHAVSDNDSRHSVLLGGQNGNEFRPDGQELVNAMQVALMERHGITYQETIQNRHTDPETGKFVQRLIGLGRAIPDVKDGVRGKLTDVQNEFLREGEGQKLLQNYLDMVNPDQLDFDPDDIPSGAGYLESRSLETKIKMTDRYGNEIGDVHRSLYHDAANDEVTAENDLLTINTEFQGLGLAESMYQSQEEAHKLAGVEEVKVYANISVGGYAWAKQGFDFSDRKQGRGHILYRLDQVFTRHGIDDSGLDQQLNDAHHSWDFATMQVEGIPVGKEAMLGSSWGGKKKLKDHWPGNIIANLSRADLFGIDIKEGE